MSYPIAPLTRLSEFSSYSLVSLFSKTASRQEPKAVPVKKIVAADHTSQSGIDGIMMRPTKTKVESQARKNGTEAPGCDAINENTISSWVSRGLGQASRGGHIPRGAAFLKYGTHGAGSKLAKALNLDPATLPLDTAKAGA